MLSGFPKLSSLFSSFSPWCSFAAAASMKQQRPKSTMVTVPPTEGCSM